MKSGHPYIWAHYREPIMSGHPYIWAHYCEPIMYLPFIGASLSEPHIDNDNSPHMWNNGLYLCTFVYLPHVCRTLVPEICVCSEILCILV